ncbi:MAG: phosphoethanolamine transferase CptA, partial [Lachnospiraceae bacterium]|nr:phosphoethanolamine transferase CptA [Lachnospiraceae bacterium]
FMTLLDCEQYGRFAGLWAAGMYGLSAGAMSTVLLIRMYAMVALFCVALLAIHLRKLCFERLGGSSFAEGNKLLILVTALGFWTQYFFLFYCLILAAVTAVILWRQKRMRELWRYVRSMVTAAVVGVLVFPFSIADVFSSGRGVEALGALASGLSGYGSRIAEFLRIVAARLGVGFVGACAIFGICCAAALVLRAFRRRRAGRESRVEKEGKSGTGEASLWCLLCIPALGYFLLAARMSPYLVDRYMMPLFPFLAFILTLAVCRVGICCAGDGKDRIMPNRGVQLVSLLLAAVTVCCQLWDPLRYQDSYLYKGYDEQLKIAEEYAQYPCICIYDGVGYYENLLEFARYDRTLLLTEEELADRADSQPGFLDADAVVVLLKHGTDREAVNRLMEYRGLHCEEVLLENGEAYGDTVLLFDRMPICGYAMNKSAK